MATPKKPKLRRFPKTPRSKSLDVLKRYAAKCADIQKENDKKMSEYKKKISAIDAAKKAVQSIKDKAKKIKSKSY